MKIIFSWEETAGAISPHCASNTVNMDGINLVSCLLMDDGGIPYLQSIPWIQEGIARVEMILSGKAESSSWDREAWGALMTIDEARIYSLHDEDYFESLTLQQLKNALVSWKSFVELKPDFGEKKIIEL